MSGIDNLIDRALTEQDILNYADRYFRPGTAPTPGEGARFPVLRALAAETDRRVKETPFPENLTLRDFREMTTRILGRGMDQLHAGHIPDNIDGNGTPLPEWTKRQFDMELKDYEPSVNLEEARHTYPYYTRRIKKAPEPETAEQPVNETAADANGHTTNGKAQKQEAAEQPVAETAAGGNGHTANGTTKKRQMQNLRSPGF